MDIDEISKLESYEECSDDDIRKYIEYCKSVAYERGMQDKITQQIDVALKNIQKYNDIAAQNAQASFDNALAIKLDLIDSL